MKFCQIKKIAIKKRNLLKNKLLLLDRLFVEASECEKLG